MTADFSVIITAIDETWSLQESVERVLADNDSDIAEIVIAIAPRTTAQCREVMARLCEQHPGRVRAHEQRQLQGVGGAIRESVALVSAPWVVFMSADMETPPEYVKSIIVQARKVPAADIVAGSRWLAGGGFGDYSRGKLACNWIFQKFFAALYATRLTDMTYGYRACKTELLRAFAWRETGHGFFMESLIKPLRAGKTVAEIPVKWRRRQEGSSHMALSEFLRYFYIGFATRFMSKRSLYASSRR